MIQINHLSKNYGKKTVLHNISLCVDRGTCVGILGENGCGKSTLMNLLAGVLEPDEGDIEVGETVKIGYFAQEEVDMDPGQRVIDYVRDIAEYIPT